MLRGIYIGASSLVAQMYNMDVISNNLANVNTPGYKKDMSIFKSFPEILVRRMNDDGVVIIPIGSYDRMPVVGILGTGVELNEVYTVHEQGPFINTSNPFDIAIEGDGFFVIETRDGEIRYTRNGSFLLDKDSYIVTKEGDYLLGEKGRIQVKLHNFTISEQGEIMVNQDLQPDIERLVTAEENEWKSPLIIDRIRIVNFRQPRRLEKVGNSFYKETWESGPATIPVVMPKVIQGSLEASNVNVVTEMVRMIEVQRAYEFSQKTIQSFDATLGKLINELARA